MKEGRIIKALSGFYYVQTNKGVYACKGRGLFRKRKVNPLVGDFVRFDITNDQEGYITEIKSRKNELLRPPVANVDQAIIVSSAKIPDFSSQLLDRFLVLIEFNNIRPIIFITKIDILTGEEYQEITKYRQEYEGIGYPVEFVIAKEGSEITSLDHYFSDQVSVITGQSGVGKSSILNALNSNLFIKTDEISSSLGRGKHTTRHVELVEISNGLVADTPGFSALEFNEIELEELADCFPEMHKREGECKFRGCLHYKEPGCAVKEAVEQGNIRKYRYESYVSFFEEIQSRKPRYS